MTDSIVLRGGTVLTMDDSHTIHPTGDVLVAGDRVAAGGPSPDAPARDPRTRPARRRHRRGGVGVAGGGVGRVGPSLEVPEGTREIDASGGIVMPGMIDTHRHM